MGQAGFTRTGRFRLALIVLAAALWCAPAVQARKAQAPEAAASQSTVALAQLPPEARQTYQRIGQGGPFPYEKDGMVFGNRERLLPVHPRGYYREYTVRTPGSRDRGARRIVCGGPPRQPNDCYYTADHYASFRRIVE